MDSHFPLSHSSVAKQHNFCIKSLAYIHTDDRLCYVVWTMKSEYTEKSLCLFTTQNAHAITKQQLKMMFS